MSPRKRALVVGINAYESAPLLGCLNDARDWTEALTARGFDVSVLLDADATKANVVAGLRRLVADAHWRDSIAFTYSGHGTWVPDADGDEADRRDEALALYDYADGGLLVDDELHALFAPLRFGVRATILSDSCHSGSVHRAVGPGWASPSEMEGRPRFLPPAAFLADRQLLAAERVAHISARGISRPGAGLLSGCADAEVAWDGSFDGRPNGAFTRAALDALTENPTSMWFWYQAIRQRLPSADYEQTPALNATVWQRGRTPL